MMSVQSQIESYQRLKRCTWCHLRIKGKVEQYKEKSNALPYESV